VPSRAASAAGSTAGANRSDSRRARTPPGEPTLAFTGHTEVDAENERAIAFYEKLGFETRRLTMRTGVDDSTG
jgi:GNAT superfamily N-acetyltransferase